MAHFLKVYLIILIISLALIKNFDSKYWIRHPFVDYLVKAVVCSVQVLQNGDL